MIKRFALLTAVVLALTTALMAAPASAVVNGVEDTNVAYPYVGALVIKTPSESVEGAFEYHYWCSGTMVSPTVFLAAGHCFDSDYLQSVFGAGTTLVGMSLARDVSGFMADDPSQFRGTGVKIPGWPGKHWQLDVGAYVLSSPVSVGALPAVPSKAGQLDEMAITGQQATIVGYGMTREPTRGRNGFTDFNDGIRRWAPQRITGVSPTMLHLLGNIAAGGSGPCAGDSGAPRFVDSGGDTMIVAISNWVGTYCQTPEMALRLDTPAILAFIHDPMTP